MWQDPIVGEVRQIREKHAAQYDFDLKTIYRELKKAEEKSGHRKVSFAPKLIKSIKTPAKPGLSV